MQRIFTSWNEAEDFAEEMVFGHNDPNLVAELIEVWPSFEAFQEDEDSVNAVLYVVWGTPDEVDAEAEAFGIWTDRKGTIEPQVEQS